MVDLGLVAAEDAELAEIRAGLIADAREVAAIEGRRVRREARAFDIAHARMTRQRLSTRQQEMELRSIALELGAPLRILDRTMQTRLTDAAALVERFGATVVALEEGRITRRHADVILDAGTVIDDPAARAAFEKVVIDFAAADTPARTRAFARQLAEHLHPRTLDERFADANERRLVTVTELADGMAQVTALLPVAVAFGIRDRLTRMAQALKRLDDQERRDHADTLTRGDLRPGSPENIAAIAMLDDRTRDQTRADLFGDLLLTGAPAINPAGAGLDAIQAHVQLTISVSTLTGVTSGGGELDGCCAVDDVTARRLAGNAPTWDRVFTHPITGTVLDVDRYEPHPSQRRFLAARDTRCRVPGCRRPARYHQIDHTRERQDGGPTTLSNLAGLCIRHHTLKTETNWTVTQLPGGALIWSSPLGYTYRDDPPKRVVFHPDDGEHDATAPPSEIAPF